MPRNLIQILTRFKRIIIAIYVYSNLRRPFKKYRIIIARGNDLMKKIYTLRYEVYCEEVKLLNRSEYPERFEKDEYDENSVHFAVLDHKNDVIGTVRLIKKSNLQFPTITEYKLEDQLKDIDKDHLVEISRFMVKKEFRKTMLMVDICKAIYLYSKKNGINFWLGCAERWFIHSMNQLFGPLNIIKEPKFCFNAMNYPFILGLDEAERNVKRISSVLNKYFNENVKNIQVYEY